MAKTIKNKQSNSGWITLHRKIVKWEWYSDPVVSRLFIHLLLKANHQQKKWRNTAINRGQVLTGRRVLARELGVSEQNIRTGLEKLKSTNEITIKSTNRFSIVTIAKWDDYQSSQPTKQPTILPTTNQQLTTNNNVNNVNNINNGKLTSSVDLEEPEKGTIAYSLKEAQKKVDNPTKRGITKGWQDQAFRFADGLGIKLEDKYKSRWFKAFKDAETKPQLNQKIQSAYGYLFDYLPFKSKNNEQRILYFFWYIGGGHDEIQSQKGTRQVGTGELL